MIFAPDTEASLETMVALINSTSQSHDSLLTGEDLDVFLTDQRFTGSRTHDAAELRSVRQLRNQLEGLWRAPEEEAVGQVNNILRNARAMPQLVKHDDWEYHIHATTPEAPLIERMAVEAAMAMVDVLRSGELSRLQECAAADCAAVFLDLSRNRSKLYCDTGNCANRKHVRAYRQRKSAQNTGSEHRLEQEPK